jgi:hypothetical protein
MDFTFSIDTQHCLANIIELLCCSSHSTRASGTQRYLRIVKILVLSISDRFISLFRLVTTYSEPACCPGSELEGPALPHNVNVTCRYLLLVGDRA